MAVKGIPVVISENGHGVPVVEVEDGNAPLMTVAENGMGMPIVLSTNGIGMPARIEGGGVPALRSEPSTADRYYIVARGPLDTGLVTRIEKNVVATAGGSDLGGADSGERITGLGIVASFDDAASGATWFANEVGAFDFVAASGGVNFGSYHGLGTGSVAGTTRTMNGVAFDHAVAKTGSSFELRTQTTASDGTNFLTRDMSVIIDSAGEATVKLWSESSSGMTLFYFGMPIVSADSYDEMLVKRASADAATAFSLGQLTNGATAWLADVRQAQMRDPTTGYYVGAYGDLPDLSGFTRCRTEKQPAFDRTKTYLGLFSSDAGLSGGAEFTLEWGTSTPGATAAPTNLLPSTDFGAGWVNNTYAGGSVDKTGGDLTMTWASGTSNLRVGAPISGCAIGKKLLASLDWVSESAPGAKQIYGSTAANLTNTSPAFTATDTGSDPLFYVAKRNIYLFTANADAAQHFAIRGALTGAGSVVFRNPAVYEVA